MKSKAIITLTEPKPGKLKVKIEFVPPIAPKEKSTVVTAVGVVGEALGKWIGGGK